MMNLFWFFGLFDKVLSRDHFHDCWKFFKTSRCKRADDKNLDLVSQKFHCKIKRKCKVLVKISYKLRILKKSLSKTHRNYRFHVVRRVLVTVLAILKMILGKWVSSNVPLNHSCRLMEYRQHRKRPYHYYLSLHPYFVLAERPNLNVSAE